MNKNTGTTSPVGIRSSARRNQLLIRSKFVTNSSSTSFLAFGLFLTYRELENVLLAIWKELPTEQREEIALDPEDAIDEMKSIIRDGDFPGYVKGGIRIIIADEERDHYLLVHENSYFDSGSDGSGIGPINLKLRDIAASVDEWSDTLIRFAAKNDLRDLKPTWLVGYRVD